MGERFRDTKVGISKVYTKTGDSGDTALVNGERVPKDDRRIEAYGTVDELNAIVGCTRDALDAGDALRGDLLRVQHQLFNLGSILATPTADRMPQQPRVGAPDIEWLESRIDAANAGLPALTSFVLPGGTPANSWLHLARTVCRRAERIVVGMVRDESAEPAELQYLNRLSDAFFVWSRAAAGDDEVLWQPDLA